MRLTPGAAVADPGTADLADPDLYGCGDPHAVWQAMRATQPVRWQPVAGRPGFWAVTSYADAEAVLSDHVTFTSTRGVMLNLLGKPEPAQDQQFAASDPPRHGRLRAPLQRRMTVKAVAEHAPGMRAHIRGLLPGGGEFDLAEITGRLPMAFLGPLMGIPQDDWPQLSRWVAMSVAEHDPDVALPEGPDATLDRGHREMFAYLLDLVLHHRRRPRGDLVDVLLGMDLSAGGIVANCYSLLLGASAAIPHVPTGTVAELMRTNAFAAWAGRPDLLPGAVEEALRFTSPAGHFLRVATRDTHVGSCAVAEGDAVVIWIGSSNRDEKVFTDPHTLDPTRHPNRHLAFGDGHHYCIGATVARLALKIFFEELFLRYRDLEPTGPAEHIRSTWLAGIKRLPVHGRLR